MYDEIQERPLYILLEGTLTKAQYEAIVEALGTVGPGYQVLKEGAKYIIKYDAVDAVVNYINGMLAEAGSSVTLTVDGVLGTSTAKGTTTKEEE